MSTAPVQVGDVWKDKDKRRNTVIEIIKVGDDGVEAVGLVVGTEEERYYSVDRLVKRWELIEHKPADEPKVIIPGSTKEDLEEERQRIRVVGGKNYHLLVECSVNGEDGQRFRTTMKQFEAFGAPLCGCHHKPMNLIEKH